MLVLYRKRGQTIEFPDLGLTIKVAGPATRLAIEAPRELRVLRGELLEPKSEDDEKPHGAETKSA